MKKFLSVAEWDSCHGFQDNKTTDTHATFEQAEAVCRMLENDGLGGERCHFPIKTYVKEVKEITAE